MDNVFHILIVWEGRKMDPRTLILAVFIAAAYVFWPMIGKWSGVDGPWMVTLIVIGTLLAVLALSYTLGGMSSTPPPSMKAIVILIIAGALNGIAIHYYGGKAADPKMQLSVFLMVIYVLMVVLAPVMDWGINHKMLTMRQWTGVLVSIFAIYLLTSRNATA